jgi:general secretion pathway protein G
MGRALYTIAVCCRVGFTLLELIVVITIIGILSTIVAVSTQYLPDRARWTKAEADMDTILTAAKVIHTTTGRYPQSIEEMVDARDDSGQDIGGIDDTVPIDPWQHPYDYEIVNDRPQVRCFGKDGVPGGEGNAADRVKPAPSRG